MPVYAADLLPDTTGRNLGSPSQRWNAFIQNLDLLGSVRYQPVPGAVIGAMGIVYVGTTPITANANITTAQALQGCTITGGLINSLGKVLRATMGGDWDTQAGQTPQMSIAVNLGGVRIYNVNTPALAAGTSGADWNASLVCTVYQTGSSAMLYCQGNMFYQPNSTPTNNVSTSLISNYDTAGPVDLTVDQTLECFVFFGTNTSPANICIQRQFIVEVLN